MTLAVNLFPTPVLLRSSEIDLLNPSVTRDGELYYNFYSEFDGRTWRTSLATSGDGHVWDKQGRVLSPDASSWEGAYIAANGSVWFDGKSWRYWYQAGGRDVPRIGMAQSRDGRHWIKVSHSVLDAGPRGSWDERGVADPYVLRIESTYYLYYLGQNRSRQQQIGLARSDDGIRWTKLRSNPVLEIPWPGTGYADENGLGEPAVWESNGWYWMLYTGRNAKEERALMAARSSDGVKWTAQGEVKGTEPWDREVVCDPTVLIENGRVRLWFGGGDKARPDENLNGQIGEGEIRSVTAAQ